MLSLTHRSTAIAFGIRTLTISLYSLKTPTRSSSLTPLGIKYSSNVYFWAIFYHTSFGLRVDVSILT